MTSLIKHIYVSRSLRIDAFPGTLFKRVCLTFGRVARITPGRIVKEIDKRMLNRYVSQIKSKCKRFGKSTIYANWNDNPRTVERSQLGFTGENSRWKTFFPTAYSERQNGTTSITCTGLKPPLIYAASTNQFRSALPLSIPHPFTRARAQTHRRARAHNTQKGSNNIWFRNSFEG